VRPEPAGGGLAAEHHVRKPRIRVAVLFEDEVVVRRPAAVLALRPVLPQHDALPRLRGRLVVHATERHPGLHRPGLRVSVEGELLVLLREVLAAVVAAVDRFLGDPLGGVEALLAGERVDDDLKERAEVDADVAHRDGPLLRGRLWGRVCASSGRIGAPYWSRTNWPAFGMLLAVDEDVALRSAARVPPHLPEPGAGDAGPQQGAAELAEEVVALPCVVQCHDRVLGGGLVLVGLRSGDSDPLRLRLRHPRDLGADERADAVVGRLLSRVLGDPEDLRAVPARPLAAEVER
jgi:hypothetical protein